MISNINPHEQDVVKLKNYEKILAKDEYNGNGTNWLLTSVCLLTFWWLKFNYHASEFFILLVII